MNDDRVLEAARKVRDARNRCGELSDALDQAKANYVEAHKQLGEAADYLVALTRDTSIESIEAAGGTVRTETA